MMVLRWYSPIVRDGLAARSLEVRRSPKRQARVQQTSRGGGLRARAANSVSGRKRQIRGHKYQMPIDRFRLVQGERTEDR
jgi:hypothetical protein